MNIVENKNIKEYVLNTFYYKRISKKTGKEIYNLRKNILDIYNKEENKNIKEYIINKYSTEYTDIEYNLKEILYRIKNNIVEIPKCLICNKHVRFLGIDGYSKTCSTKCNRILLNKLTKETRNKHNLILIKKQYKHSNNITYNNLIQNINHKYDRLILNVMFLKNNVLHANRIRFITYGRIYTKYIHGKGWKSRYKEYNNIKQYLEHRYDDIPKEAFTFREVILRIKHNIDVRPVCPHCGKPVSFIGKTKILYGKFCSASCRSSEVNIKFWREAIKDYRFGPEQLKKREQTCLEKYGVKSTFQLKSVKEKVYKTKLKHKTYKKSKQEDNTYLKLITLFGLSDIKRQYKSIAYPFACDFYIVSLDIYIECNYHWSHGNHPFDINNVEDKIEYEKLLSSSNINNKKYNPTLDVWCNRDVKKYNIAKKNNLNYLVFYTPKEFNDWYYSFGMSVT